LKDQPSFDKTLPVLVFCRHRYVEGEKIMNMDEVKEKWGKWDNGGKAIFAGACVGAVSMLLPWVDIAITSRNGLSQGTFLLLGFWYYPVRQILNSAEIDRNIGLGCGIGATLLTMGYINSKSMGVLGNAAAIGSYLFFIASCALIYGVLKHQPAAPPSA
jgi:hypothetical protein